MSELIAELDRSVRPDYHMFGIADRGSVGEATPTPGQDWLGVGDTGVLISVSEDLVSPSLRLEVWDGPPPATDGQQHELHVPSGAVTVMHLRSIESDRTERTGGSIGRFFRVPPGNYRVLAVAEPPARYTVRFWTMMD